MAQVFHPGLNPFAKGSVIGAVLLIAAAFCLAGGISRSPYLTQTRVVRTQPVPFSHRHHVGGLGLDCRYCHTSVEESSFAGMPATKTCMNCHAQIWADSPVLEAVRASFASGRPIAWTRVHDLPDFVFFDHSIHVRKGVACATCHGRVDEMPLLWQEKSLFMEWCLDCHRHPERYVGPRERVFALEGAGPEAERGRDLVRDYKIGTPTNCSDCHR